VYFEHDGQRFAFRTHVIGPDTWRDARLELAAWKLELPEKVERKQQRDHYRVSLLDLGEIPVTFARVDDTDNTFEATLLNISAGGISARAALSLADRISSHEPYWTQFHLPHEPTRFAFVIRVMHVRPNEQQKIVLLGCRFCQLDDPRLHQAQLRRFERYIAGRQRARLSRVTQHNDAGGK
jgi:c-di-GMP-binding flagellar brake protein YcgR